MIKLKSELESRRPWGKARTGTRGHEEEQRGARVDRRRSGGSTVGWMRVGGASTVGGGRAALLWEKEVV